MIYSDDFKLLKALGLTTVNEIYTFGYFRSMIYVYLQIPIAEEMIFREMIFNFLYKRTKYFNLIQAVLFALFHLSVSVEDLIQDRKIFLFIFYVIIGIVFGNIKKETKNINICIAFHILYSLTYTHFGLLYIKYFFEFTEKLFRFRLKNDQILICLFILPVLCLILTFRKMYKNIYLPGIFYGNVKRRTGNIWTGIFIHSLKNLIAGFPINLYLYKMTQSVLKIENEQLLLIFTSIIPLILFIWTIKKLGKTSTVFINSKL